MGGCVVSLMDNKHKKSLQPSLAIQNYRAYGPDSVAVPNTGTSSSSNIYRNGRYHSDAELISWREKTYGGPNQTQRFAKSCEERAETPMLAYRQQEKVVKEEVPMPNGGTKMMEISYMGERQNLTGAQLWQYTTDFSRGLGELGLPPRSHVAIYEETRWEWLPTIYGIWLQDAVATTVYANLGEEALFYALNETQCSAIVCNGRNIPNLLRGVASGAFKACTIIYFGTLSAECSATVGDCRLVAWQDVISLGSKACDRRQVTLPTDNDSTALIMYTSGTTGDPKGVVHSHGSITAGILIMDEWLISLLGEFLPHETYCAYLPLAHIMEFGVVSIFLGRGALVGFGNPRTLTDATARPHGDVNEYRPTCLIGVPRIFDTIRRAIEAKLPPVGTLRRRVFDYAYQSRLAALQNGQETPYWNEKVFKPARAALGGRLRLMLSGGGPLSQVTQEFVGVVLGNLVLGWGLTETVCCGAIMRSGDMDLGTVGQVLVAEELKLLDTEDYKHTDSPEPRGELCLRGPFMFKGYYKHPELTKEVLGDDGWFRTGDIGSIDSKGHVRIIGRIKALAKNCLGEYIALEVLESIYNNHPLVLNNCSCVLTHPERNYIALIAVTDEAKATAFARTHNIEGPFPAVLRNKEFRRRAAESMAEFATAAKRQRFECVKTVCLVDDEWSPENNLLTAAMKLKRQVINAKYANDLNELFASE